MWHSNRKQGTGRVYAAFAAGILICVVQIGTSDPTAIRFNGNFEQVLPDGRLKGWTCTTDGEDPATLIAFATDTASRAIRITSRGHNVEWVSEKIPVPAEMDARLRFRIQASGERHWAFALKFCDCVLTFFDAGGGIISEVSREIHVLRTDGWAHDAFRFTTPKKTNSMQISFRSSWPPVGTPKGTASELARFWYGTGEGHPGEYLIDEIALEPIQYDLPKDKNNGVLRIRTVDAQTGNEVPARILIPSSPNLKLDTYQFSEINGFIGREEGPITVELPAGLHRIRAIRGFLWKPVEQEIRIAAGETADATLAFTEQPGRSGWHGQWKAGDHHLHMFFHGHTKYPLMTIPDVCHIAQAEGLDYISLQAEMAWVKQNVENNPDYVYDDLICEVAHEITTDFWGHVNYINVKHIPNLPAPLALWPVNFTFREEVEKYGGFLIYTHPFGHMTDENTAERLADQKIGLIARELPIDLLLGQQTMVDMLSSEGIYDLQYKMKLLERLWNLGFRFGVGGSSDCYVDQGVITPGGFRTYVNTEKNDFDSIAQAYCDAHTFATNGPLLDLTVNNQGPGREIRLDSPRVVSVRATAHSWWGLDRLEIVNNGNVVFYRDSPQEIAIGLNHTLSIEESGWIYARVWGPPSDELCNTLSNTQFAMTSPIWITVADRPQEIHQENVEFFRDWLHAVEKALPGYRERLTAAGEFGSEDYLRQCEDQAREFIEKAMRRLEEIAGH